MREIIAKQHEKLNGILQLQLYDESNDILCDIEA